MLIDVPIGKALVPVENKNCNGCYFEKENIFKNNFKCRNFACGDFNRQDGKNIIFKLVDYPPTFLDCSVPGETADGKCIGYQKSDDDDEPHDKCKKCRINQFYEEE